MQKSLIAFAGLLGALSIIIGAFGAHALKTKITVEQLQIFETGVKYQIYHVLALLAVALLLEKYTIILLTYAGLAFILGIILFSGSLYLLATKDLLGVGSWNWLGPITPIGGLFFILGWLLIFISFIKK